jgi:hypothetical protein
MTKAKLRSQVCFHKFCKGGVFMKGIMLSDELRIDLRFALVAFDNHLASSIALFRFLWASVALKTDTNCASAPTLTGTTEWKDLRGIAPKHSTAV